MVRTLLGLVLIALICTTTDGWAGCARCRAAAGWGCASEPSTAFDVNTVRAFEGKVVSVQDVEPDEGLIPGVYILVEATDGNYSCRLGSRSALSGLDVQPNDQISLHGSLVHKEKGIPAVIATDVTKDSRTVTLRSAQGL